MAAIDRGGQLQREHSAEPVSPGTRYYAGVGARHLQECLLIQLEGRNARGGVAWQIVANHIKLLENRQLRELGKTLGRPQEHIQIAVSVIKTLDPRPGLRYSHNEREQGASDHSILLIDID